MIGFNPPSYEVDEGAGVVTLVVEVLDGVLDTEIQVRLSTADAEAVCKLELLVRTYQALAISK